MNATACGDVKVHTWTRMRTRTHLFINTYAYLNAALSIVSKASCYITIRVDNIPAEHVLRVPVVYNISRSD